MYNDLVSIIITTYNYKNCVSDAIDCSLQQTHKNCEVLVIDDGSNDGTGAFLTEKYGKRIRYFYQKNKGLSAARNTGIKNAGGDYIQFLDADDILAVNKIEKQLNVLRGHSGLALSYCDYVICDLRDKNIVMEKVPYKIVADRPLYDLAARWETDLSLPPHSFLFSRDIFNKYGILFDESLANHEDWDCWMRIFALNPAICFVDEELALYRRHDEAMCSNERAMREGYLMAISKQQRIFSFDPEMVMILKEKRREVRYQYRDAGSMGRILNCLPWRVRELGRRIIPWRIRRLFA
jgi:glycosyltransferase involved in cell wall biosynthesis